MGRFSLESDDRWHMEKIRGFHNRIQEYSNSLDTMISDFTEKQTKIYETLIKEIPSEPKPVIQIDMTEFRNLKKLLDDFAKELNLFCRDFEDLRKV